MFLGDNLLPLLVLALGGAMFFGNLMAVVRPPSEPRRDGDLDKAPIARSALMGVVGLLAGLWAIATLVS
jgi:hypothetical protein